MTLESRWSLAGLVRSGSRAQSQKPSEPSEEAFRAPSERLQNAFRMPPERLKDAFRAPEESEESEDPYRAFSAPLGQSSWRERAEEKKPRISCSKSTPNRLVFCPFSYLVFDVFG